MNLNLFFSSLKKKIKHNILTLVGKANKQSQITLMDYSLFVIH
jgi:ABC-type thiamine transport system ATPase subunit